MKKTLGLDRHKVLRPTRGVEKHHLNIRAEENQQVNAWGPSNQQKSSGPNQLK